MSTIGCGFLFTGLLLGALSGSFLIGIVTICIGLVLIGCAYLHEYKREKKAQAWRKNYPIYRY